jgi:hypothetical protein
MSAKLYGMLGWRHIGCGACKHAAYISAAAAATMRCMRLAAGQLERSVASGQVRHTFLVLLVLVSAATAAALATSST